MQKALAIFISILFVFTGCNYVYDKPLSNEQILNRLERYIEKKQTIVLSYNPALQYEVTITKDFLEILHIHDWTIDPDNSIPKDNLRAMVYFDLYNGKENFNRIAVFQNGYALVQTNIHNEFGEKQWYDCHLSEGFFDLLTIYIQNNLIKEVSPMN